MLTLSGVTTAAGYLMRDKQRFRLHGVKKCCAQQTIFPDDGERRTARNKYSAKRRASITIRKARTFWKPSTCHQVVIMSEPDFRSKNTRIASCMEQDAN